MHPDPNCPARNAEQASDEHVGRVEPETFAHWMFAQIVDLRGDAAADLYLARMVAEVQRDWMRGQ